MSGYKYKITLTYIVKETETREFELITNQPLNKIRQEYKNLDEIVNTLGALEIDWTNNRTESQYQGDSLSTIVNNG